MTLNELKVLLEIDLADVSQDVRLEIELDAAREAAVKYCDLLDFMQLIDPADGKIKLPGTVKLGMVEWIKANQEISERGGVSAESIGGMSQTFENGDTAFNAAHRYWAPYHSEVKFYRA